MQVTAGNTETKRKRFSIYDETVGGDLLWFNADAALVHINAYLGSMEPGDSAIFEIECIEMTDAEFRATLKDTPTV